jgi:hypothetical protein
MIKKSDIDRTAIGVSNRDLKLKSDLRKFSFFKQPITNTKPYKNIGLIDAYNAIRQQCFKSVTEELRKISDKNMARKFKSVNFNYVTFSGVFTHRSISSLVEHSCFMVIDFDDLPSPIDTKEMLLKDSEIETQLLFLSPSGNGLKWVIEIDLEIATHEQYFYGIRNYLKQKYNLSLDESGKDVSRACFLPYDKDVFINPKYLTNDF